MKTTLLRTLCTALAFGLLAAGCNRGPETPAELVKTGEADTPLVTIADPEANGGHSGRAPRRLTVTQLDASIKAATGQAWTDLPGLAASLGRADFALINAESTEPNLVFAKFLEDGARKVCMSTAASDLAAGKKAVDRVLSHELPDLIPDLNAVSEAAVRANIAYLALRFWGSEMSTEETDRYYASFKRAATTLGKTKRDQVLALHCVVMLTDPRFLTY